MPAKIRQALLISMTMIALLVASVMISYAETVNYIYDELNRLIRIEYGDGTKIEYTYDGAGNRSHVYMGRYTLTVNVVGSGTVTKNPDQPIYSPGTSVTLTAVNGSQTFSEWSGDLTGNTNPTNIVMDGNKSVTATFITPQGWLQGWTYRKAVTLSRASGAVTNYQMKLLVGESSGASGENVDCNGHIQANFNDLRFTTSDETTLLNYWIESITGTTPNQLATVWIKFDSIGTSDTTFYMYYGKADATAYSNGDNTFIFFDHFPGSSLDASKWTIVQGDVTVASSELILTGTTGTRGIIRQNSTNYPFGPVGAAVTSKARHSDTSPSAAYWCAMSNGASPADQISMNGSTLASRVQCNNYNEGTQSQQNVDGVATLNASHIWHILWTAANTKFYQESTLLSTLTTNVPDEAMGAIFVEGNTVGDFTYVDWVLIRKYVSPEPTWGGWGAEQAN
jgi:YD repeat-containing protein